MGIKRGPFFLGSNKIEHLLAIGDVWFERRPPIFLVELREQFGAKKYCPDAFFVHRGRAYLLELQLYPLSTAKWAEKWAIATEYFDGGHHRKASWQLWPGKVIRPNILVLSQQGVDVIRGGSNLPIRIIRDIKELV